MGRRQLRPDQMRVILHGLNPRDRFAIALGLNTGLRAADAAALTVGAFDRSTSYVTVFVQKTQ